MENCFRDREFSERHKLGTVNSVNIVRILGQVVHYIWAYFHVIENKNDFNGKVEVGVVFLGEGCRLTMKTFSREKNTDGKKKK